MFYFDAFQKSFVELGSNKVQQNQVSGAASSLDINMAAASNPSIESNIGGKPLVD